MRDEIEKKLRDPFPPAEIEWRVGATTKDKKKGIALAYIDARAVMRRLDEVFGWEGWENSYEEFKDGSICTITVFPQGRGKGELLTAVSKSDGANITDIEPFKGMLSRAFVRAAAHFGIGRCYYYLPKEWVPIRPAGKSFLLGRVPDLPEWCLPGGAGVPPGYEGNPDPVQRVKDELDATEVVGPEQIDAIKTALMDAGMTMQELERIIADNPEIDGGTINDIPLYRFDAVMGFLTARKEAEQ